jgi:Lrp/AsnC family leucine-responsive transcriptional regulator
MLGSKSRGERKIMTTKHALDELDKKILAELQDDCRSPLQEIAEKVEAPVSTVHYRVKRLEKEGIILRYSAVVDHEKLEMDYITVISVKAKYGPNYYKSVGEEIAKVPGVWAVYFSLGPVDFFVLTRARDRKEYMRILDRLMEIKGIVRTSTNVITRVIKEDIRIDI